MSPRQRTISDEKVLEAANAAISRVGPAKFTLADVGRQAGLSPATLVQRFGSKRGLVLALARAGADSVEACFAQYRAAHRSPLKALMAAATEMTRHMKTPEEAANGLAFLQMDVSDPDLRALAAENFSRIDAGYRALLDDAVAAREMRPCDTAALARAVSALSGGSLIAWAIHRTGDAESWVQRDLETLIGPWRAQRAARRARRLRSPKRR
jgi:AcrR family transcriptional regulator